MFDVPARSWNGSCCCVANFIVTEQSGGGDVIMTVAAPASAGVYVDEAAIRRAVIACGIGQIFEIYDFVIYGLMAGALAHAFFPTEDPIAGLLSTFATFAVGFVMRPVGAVVIGAYGDRHGRRAALVVTIGLMAVATGAVGLIPSYNSLGLAAPVLLVLCRMMQGFSTGGEWGGSAAFLVEYAPPSRRGLIGSYQQAATALGLLAATLVSFLLTSFMDSATFMGWGWRLAFLIGFVLGPVGYYLRTKVEETPAFERTVAKRSVSRSPLRRSLTEYPGPVLAAFGVSIIGCVVNYVFLIFLPSFAQQQLHILPSATFLSTLIAGVIYLVLTPLTGRLSDRVGRKPLFFAASGASVILAYPLFQMLVSMHSVTGLMLTQAVASVILTLYTGPICAILSEMFPTNIRYTALSVSYGFAVAIFGGFAPLISAGLIRLTGDPLAPAYYVIVAGVLSFVATAFVRERAGLPLPEDIAPLETPLEGKIA
jgi:MFS transporter, MHS family, proline/betaine transporter